MREIELSAGSIEYEDTGGNGPVVVLLHGFLMDASLWDGVIADLSVDHRCLAPTLPLGAHRRAMRPGADLSLREIARLVAEFLDRLDLGHFRALARGWLDLLEWAARWWTRESQNTQPSELRFCARLTEGASEKELALV